MKLRRPATVAAASALALAAPAAAAAPTLLLGEVGPYRIITLKTKGGQDVATVTMRPGKYAIRVRDRAPTLDFRITGPGLNNKILTTKAFVGTKTANVTLRTGTYRYFAATQGSMRRTFRVGG